MRTLVLLLVTAAATLLGWRAWNSRGSDQVSFDWDVPPPPEPSVEPSFGQVEPAQVDPAPIDPAPIDPLTAPEASSGNDDVEIADAEQREVESRREPETKFQQDVEEEAEARREAAARLATDPLTERLSDTDG